jgi:hypothetical protein
MPAACQLEMVPIIAESEVERMVLRLGGRDWITAAQLLRECDGPIGEAGKRQLRAIAEASEGRIAGGQQGYRLVADMTREELDHVCNAQMSQCSKMTERVRQMQAVWTETHKRR